MQEFDDRREQAQLVALMPECATAEQDQKWAQALATGRGDIVPDLFYQGHARRQLLADNAVNGSEIVRYDLVEGLGLHRGLLGDCAACYEPGRGLSRQLISGLAWALLRAYNRGP